MIVWFTTTYPIRIIRSRKSRGVRVMVFNTTFNKILVISWRSVLLMEYTGVPGEKKHRPATSRWQNHIMLYWVYLAMRGIQPHNVSGDSHRVYSINKTDRHDITKILLKVVLNTITLTPLDLRLLIILMTSSNYSYWHFVIVYITKPNNG
jgi:hypothetical protein